LHTAVSNTGQVKPPKVVELASADVVPTKYVKPAKLKVAAYDWLCKKLK
jgi:hypothetical protein